MKHIPFYLDRRDVIPRVRQILFVAPAPIVWAHHFGTFASNGIEVETTQTLSSDQIGQGLAQGTWDVGVGVMDNIVAWNAERRADLRILAQLERSQVMSFFGRAGATTLQEAAYGRIAVDATSNGFVLVLYRALAKVGQPRYACRFELVGGVRQRFEALMEGRTDATILVPPFIGRADAAGFARIWNGSDIAPAYPGVVAAARSTWISEHPGIAEAYLRALLQANARAADQASRSEACEALQAAGYDPQAAERLMAGQVAGLRPSRAGWNETIALRLEAGLLSGDAPVFDAVVDERLMKRATLAHAE